MSKLKKTLIIVASLSFLGLAPVHAQKGHKKEKWDDKEWKQKGKDENGKWKNKGKWNKDHNDDGRWGNTGDVRPYLELKVPPGHLPPPGQCRVWLPNVPPGHQPAPQDCASASYSAPPGAWVITNQGDRYRVNVYDVQRPNVLQQVLYYLTR